GKRNACRRKRTARRQEREQRRLRDRDDEIGALLDRECGYGLRERIRMIQRRGDLYFPCRVARPAGQRSSIRGSDDDPPTRLPERSNRGKCGSLVAIGDEDG